MMTLKLATDGRTKIFEAAFFTITEEGPGQPGRCNSWKITAHNMPTPIGYDDYPDHCWWVGAPPYSVDDGRIFTAAYIMNERGKTVDQYAVPILQTQNGVPVAQHPGGIPNGGIGITQHF